MSMSGVSSHFNSLSVSRDRCLNYVTLIIIGRQTHGYLTKLFELILIYSTRHEIEVAILLEYYRLIRMISLTRFFSNLV